MLSDHRSRVVLCSSVCTNLALGDKDAGKGKEECCGTRSAGSLPSQPGHGLKN